MSARPSMSERQRVLLALQGIRYPREGDHGLYTSRRSEGVKHFRVQVVRVSPTGQTIWTRFVTDNARRHLHTWCDHENRWWRVPDDDFFRFDNAPLYRAGGDSACAPPGEISFPAVAPEETV